MAMINLANKKIELPIQEGVLKTLVREDVHQGYIDGLNDSEVNNFLVGVAQSKQTVGSVASFVEHGFVAANEMVFGIWNKNEPMHCGTVRLHGIDLYHHTAHIGVCLFNKDVWGIGLAKKSICAVTDWGLNTLGLRWIEAGAYEENIASVKLFERAGYQKKYTVEGKYLLHGKASNAVVLAACIDHI